MRFGDLVYLAALTDCCLLIRIANNNRTHTHTLSRVLFSSPLTLALCLLSDRIGERQPVQLPGGSHDGQWHGAQQRMAHGRDAGERPGR